MRYLLVPMLAGMLLSGCETLEDTFSFMSVGGEEEAAFDPIASAMSAGPASISKDATITDLQGNVLRQGSNGWTCIPDDTNAEFENPWCFNQPWLDFRTAMMSGAQPNITQVGIAYMLMGDAPVSNLDPAATGPTADNQWLDGDIGMHLMMVVPGENGLDGYSSDPANGGPWVMWPDTPYAHLMVPIDSMD